MYLSDASSRVSCALPARAAAVNVSSAVSHLQMDRRHRGPKTPRHSEVNTLHTNTEDDVGAFLVVEDSC